MRSDQRISIHAPRTGSDRMAARQTCGLCIFQSTLPARGATAAVRTVHRDMDFNPRSPHGERPPTPPHWKPPCAISIHAPRTGSDVKRKENLTNQKGFQSTLPARGATEETRTQTGISSDFNPRSPHGERLISPSKSQYPFRYFNPRSPHGERRAYAVTHTPH